MTTEFVQTDKAPQPMGPYSLAAVFGNMAMTAGQLPIDPATGSIVEGGIEDQARQCIRNLEAVLEAGGFSLRDVVRLGVFLIDMDDLSPVATVREEFWSDPHPPSTTVQVVRLPHPQAMIEVDALAAVQSGS